MSSAPSDPAAQPPVSRRALAIVAALVGAGLAVLLVYSLDRTAWAFTIYETGQANAEHLGWNAALVLEIAAVALIIGMSAVGVLPAPYSGYVRRWAGPCLAAILAVQVSANMTAGFLRGSLPMYRELAATGMVAGPALWAAYAVQAALWFSVNGIIPLLIFGLAKIEAQLVGAILAVPEPDPADSDQGEKDRPRRRWPAWFRPSPNGVSAGTYLQEGDPAPAAPAAPANRVSAGTYLQEGASALDAAATNAATDDRARGVSAGTYLQEGDFAHLAPATPPNRVSAGTYLQKKDRALDAAALDAATAWQAVPTAPTTALVEAPPNGVSAGTYLQEGDSAPDASTAALNRVSAGTYLQKKDRALDAAALDAATAWQEPTTAAPDAATADRARGVSAGTYLQEGDSAPDASTAALNGVSAGTYLQKKDRALDAAATAATDAAADDRSGPQWPAADAVQIFARSGVPSFVTAGDDPALPPQPIYPPPVAVNSTAIYPCPHGCGALLTFGEKGAAKRYKRCKHCPPTAATT
jgi:hypothetical protein